MGLRIGMNAHFLKYPSSDIGQYVQQLTSTLLQLKLPHEYLLLNPRGEHVQHTAPRAQQVVLPVPWWAQHHANLEQCYWEQRTITRALEQQRIDVLHNPHFAAPLFARQPVIVTVPDTIHFRMPAYLLGHTRQLYLHFNILAARRAAKIITVSEHAKRDIVDMLGIPPEKIAVTYLAADHELQPVRDESVLSEVRAHYGLGANYLFYLGGLDQRKNVLQLVRAFALLCQRVEDEGLQLFIAGDPTKLSGPQELFPDPRPLATRLGVESRIVYGDVAVEDKSALYSGAQAFVYPSAYESFGLPALEAMQCGTPVVCSNRTSLPEVVGRAAVTINPDDCQSLSNALYAVLHNPTLRRNLQAASIQQAQRFSWHKTAQQTLALYEHVALSARSG